MPALWVNEWNDRIAAWLACRDAGNPPAGCTAGTDDILGTYVDQGAPAMMLDRNALPEPYAGDPLSKGLTAVVLTLNPGLTVVPDQVYPGGQLIADVRAAGYYAVASRWRLAAATIAWWTEKARWVCRVAGRNSDLEEIVGIDLLPWHSRNFGGLLDTPSGNRWLEQNVFQPAFMIAPRTLLGRTALPNGRAIAFAFGAGIRDALLAVGWHHVHGCPLGPANGPGVFPAWPRHPGGRPLDYRLTRLEHADHARLAVIEVHINAAGMNLPPQVMDPLVRGLIDGTHP